MFLGLFCTRAALHPRVHADPVAKPQPRVYQVIVWYRYVTVFHPYSSNPDPAKNLNPDPGRP